MVTGIVGTNVDYGAAWEYGFDLRVGAGARGGPRTLLGAARDAYFAKHPPGVRHVAERSFLRSALREFMPEFRAEMQEAVRRAARM
jgi:hypothetical protein